MMLEVEKLRQNQMLPMERELQALLPPVSVVVVNYNGLAHLDQCLSSLQNQSYPLFEVILVDNCSKDGSLELVQRDYLWVKVIACHDNLGYSGAVNLAVAHASSKYIAILNMDVVVEPDWLEFLVTFMEAHPEAGAVTPKILLYNTPDRINALGQNVHVTGLGFNRRFNYPVTVAEERPFKVSGIHGSAFLLKKQLFEYLGGMNEANFMYHEDVDVSWLVSLAGYDLYCVPDSVVYHKYDLFMSPWKLYYLERNRWALLFTTFSWQMMLLMLPFLLLTEMMMIGYCTRRGYHFLAAKARSMQWNWHNRRHIRQRRSQIQALRRRSDLQLLGSLRFNYDWDQLLHLAR